MRSVIPMPAMMEQVHDEAPEEEQVRKRSEQVGTMLGPQQERRDHEEPSEDPPERGSAPSFVMFVFAHISGVSKCHARDDVTDERRSIRKRRSSSL